MNYMNLTLPDAEHTNFLVQGDELFISGPISSCAPGGLWASLREIENGPPNTKETLRVWINSPGGDVDGGYGMCDLLRAHPKPIEMVVCGIAESMAAVIFQAADVRVMTPTSSMMLHGPCWDVSGLRLEDTRAHLRVFNKMWSATAKAILKRAKRSCTTWDPDDAKTWFTGDHVFTAREAVDKGLADGIFC